MSAAPVPEAHELFFHEVRREGRPLAVLRGLMTPNGAVVEAEIYPLSEQPGIEPLKRPFPFSTAQQATRFADEALASLEHLGCILV